MLIANPGQPTPNHNWVYLTGPCLFCPCRMHTGTGCAGWQCPSTGWESPCIPATTPTICWASVITWPRSVPTSCRSSMASMQANPASYAQVGQVLLPHRVGVGSCVTITPVVCMKCPYFLPQLDGQYAGEPSFLCTGGFGVTRHTGWVGSCVTITLKMCGKCLYFMPQLDGQYTGETSFLSTGGFCVFSTPVGQAFATRRFLKKGSLGSF